MVESFWIPRIQEKGMKRTVPVKATNIATNEVTYYSSIKELVKLGFSNGCVSQCINGKQRKHKGFRFERAGDAIQEKGQ